MVSEIITKYNIITFNTSIGITFSSSSAFPAMLDLQFREYGEVRSLPQCLNRSPKLPVGIHRTGPCLASQSVEGGAGLKDVVGV